ncbi:MAG: hypothetical protein MUE51_04615 [Thermoleophilia bacterium]|jgi:hypothetical protein|nr:hypothetical protein [Thermoleophilia bacterium]
MPHHPVRRRGALALTVLAAVPAAALAAPAATQAPSIPTTIRFGETVRCAQGTWSGSPVAFRYSWVFQGTERASGPTLAVTDPYYRYGVPLTCVVTATDAAGQSASATSNGVIPGQGVPRVQVTQVRALPKGVVEIRGRVSSPGTREGLLGPRATVTITVPVGPRTITQLGGPVRVDSRGRFRVRAVDGPGRRAVTVRFTSESFSLWGQATVQRTVVFTPGGRRGGSGGSVVIGG